MVACRQPARLPSVDLMKSTPGPRCPLRWIVMALLAVPVLALVVLAGAGVRSVELDHCRATVRVDGQAISGSDEAFRAACAQLTGFRRSRLPVEEGSAVSGRRVELEFEAGSLTEGTLRLTEWRVHFQPALQLTIEELTYHSAWVRRERGEFSLGVRQTLSSRDLDAAALTR